MDDSYKRLNKYINKTELANHLVKIIEESGDIMKKNLRQCHQNGLLQLVKKHWPKIY